jgi:hypothetical protein
MLLHVELIVPESFRVKAADIARINVFEVVVELHVLNEFGYFVAAKRAFVAALDGLRFGRGLFSFIAIRSVTTSDCSASTRS